MSLTLLTDLLEQFSEHFELSSTMSKLSTDNIEKISNMIEKNDFQSLFMYSIEHELDDIAIYLYVFHGVTYELNTIQMITSIESNTNMNANVNETSETQNTTINLSYWSNHDKAKVRLNNKLLKLRKYSISERRGKQWWYKLNTKYIDSVKL